MDGKDLSSRDVYTRSIAHAAALVALGCHPRAQLPITATREQKGSTPEVLFWFENEQIEVAGVKASTSDWLRRLACPWPAFDLPNEHPVAYLKAANENRQNLLPAIRSAQDHPFRVILRGGRCMVVGSNVSPERVRRLIAHG